VSGLLPLVVLAAGLALFVALDSPGLERTGPPIEELAVERTVLRPGEIELHVTNDGPDPVRIEQVIVNDGFARFSQSSSEIGRLGGDVITVRYPWVEGESYEVSLLTATGAGIDTSIEAASETPEADASFYGLMALIGLYVGVIPVAIGMLWLPWVRRIDPRWVRFLLALTVGLLLWLAIDAVIEGAEFAGGGPEAFGGPALVFLGAAVAYAVLAGADAFVRRRRGGGDDAAGTEGGGAGTDHPARMVGAGTTAAVGGLRLAFIVALGIGLHNLGEGLAIGSSYAIGSLALGASLIVGFALHNTTEGLAIVAPVAGGAREGDRPRRIGRLAALGLLAGAPAILGAWIGASAFDPSLAAFMFGLGAGAILQVIVQLAPSVRDDDGRLLGPVGAGGIVAGMALMYATGLLIAA
jgi:zinc transporter ZupT